MAEKVKQSEASVEVKEEAPEQPNVASPVAPKGPKLDPATGAFLPAEYKIRNGSTRRDN